MGGGGGSFYKGPGDIDKLEEIARRELKRERDEEKPQRRRIFISFIHTDKTSVDLFRGQAKNERTDLDFIDMSLRAPFNSENADYIRSGIKERIKQSSVTLVYVSDDTYKSEWVDWEIRESLKQGKGVVVVNTGGPSTKMPDAVNENKNEVKLIPNNHKEIMNAIDEAAEDR